MNTQREYERKTEIEQLATYRIHVIKWLLTGDTGELERATSIAQAHDKTCACKECKLSGFAARHKQFAENLTNGDVKAWHRLLSWFDSEGRTGFYQRVHVTFGSKIYEAFPLFFKVEYKQILAKSPFGLHLKRASVDIKSCTIEISCYDAVSLLVFLKKIGLSDIQIKEFGESRKSLESVTYDLIMGDHGKSADIASGEYLCGI